MLVFYACLAGAFLVAERLFARRAQPVLRQGFVTDLLYVPVHILLRVGINGSLAIAITDLGRRVLPEHIIGLVSGQHVVLQTLVLLVTIDAIFYVIHRAKHRFRWWWRLHETHHSSVEMDWLSGARFHPFERALDRLIYLMPLMVLGASDEALVAWAVVDAFVGMFVHSNLPVRLGPLIYVVNGPEMHLWHHTPEAASGGCNFGNNFSFFDWIFGTARLPGRFPERLGLDDPAYPHGNLLRQFAYAFRRGPVGERSASADPSAPPVVAPLAPSP